MSSDYSNDTLATAVYTVNRHAKTAPDNKNLYELKRRALEKMIESGKASKIGLHFVKNPRFSKQQSSVLVKCEDFYFHILPKKEDFSALPHLGELDDHYRNPQKRMSLNYAKQVLSSYTGMNQMIIVNNKKPRTFHKQYGFKRNDRFFNTKSSYFD
jgi:hypothetical protein